MTLPDPTIVDLIDAAVGASNNVLLHAYNHQRAGAPRPVWWERLVDADYVLNSVQDTIHYQAGLIDEWGNPTHKETVA